MSAILSYSGIRLSSSSGALKAYPYVVRSFLVRGLFQMNSRFREKHADRHPDSRVHVTIYDKEEQVYQVPDFVVPRPEGSISADESMLDVSIEEEPFSFTITRKSNDEEIFSSKGSNIVFETQYWRLRTSLPDNPSLYGLGEHTDSLRLPTSNYVRTLWARDAGAVPQNTNLYGTHPVYYEHRAGSGNTHGVLLLNSNGMDIRINNDDGQYLEYNVLGGIVDLYILAGPSAFDVAREYSEITQKAAMMPYWGLGFHQCRFGYESVEEVAAVVANYSAADIPLETMWTGMWLKPSAPCATHKLQTSTTWTITRCLHSGHGFLSMACAT